jgi:hypothetical protein
MEAVIRRPCRVIPGSRARASGPVRNRKTQRREGAIAASLASLIIVSRHFMNRRLNDHERESTIRDSNQKHLKSQSPLLGQHPSGRSSFEALKAWNLGTRSP